jgi:hypothetical protein
MVFNRWKVRGKATDVAEIQNKILAAARYRHLNRGQRGLEVMRGTYSLSIRCPPRR